MQTVVSRLALVAGVIAMVTGCAIVRSGGVSVDGRNHGVSLVVVPAIVIPSAMFWFGPRYRGGRHRHRRH